MRRVKLFPLVLAFVALFSAVPVQAFDEEFYASNDILYYDDRATACLATESIPSSGPGTSSADQDKNAEAILRNLTAKGLTLAQATGFVGNMKQESGLNPAIIQGGAIATADYVPKNTVGFGLVQWTFTSRQKPLMDLARATNRDIIDINLQMDYVWQEINGTYKSTLQALTANPSITPTDAAIIVHGRTLKVSGDPRFSIAPRLGYEASADSAADIIKVRGGAAEFYYNMFKGKIADGTGVAGGTTTDGQRQVSVAGNACGTLTTVTADCPVTAPIYGEGGNTKQMTQLQLEKLYGIGGPPVEPSLVTMDFMGKPVKVHKLVAPCLQAVVNDITKANVGYNVKVIGGYRAEAGAGQVSLRSGYHFYGAAIDINPDQNGYFEGGASHPYDMPKQYIDIFHAHGFSWGGNWKSVKDYMHFEFNGIDPSTGTNMDSSQMRGQLR